MRTVEQTRGVVILIENGKAERERPSSGWRSSLRANVVASRVRWSRSSKMYIHSGVYNILIRHTTFVIRDDEAKYTRSRCLRTDRRVFRRNYISPYPYRRSFSPHLYAPADRSVDSSVFSRENRKIYSCMRTFRASLGYIVNISLSL